MIPIPLYDHMCSKGHVHEAIMPVDKTKRKCTLCGRQAKRIMSLRGVHCANQDAEWIRDVVRDKRGIGVVSGTSRKPHVVEFRKNPTRENYQKWMKGEGIRPFEDGEKPVYKHEVDTERLFQKGYEEYRKMKAIEVRTR